MSVKEHAEQVTKFVLMLLIMKCFTIGWEEDEYAEKRFTDFIVLMVSWFKQKGISQIQLKAGLIEASLLSEKLNGIIEENDNDALNESVHVCFKRVNVVEDVFLMNNLTKTVLDLIQNNPSRKEEKLKWLKEAASYSKAINTLLPFINELQ